MYFKNNTKQRIGTIQGLRSLKDTLPKNIKKIINKRGHIYSEILNNWKLIVGTSLFKICYPKFYQSSNKFNDSTLVIVVERGHEVELEYSRKEIINRINNFFEYSAVKKIRLMSFEDEKISPLNKKEVNKNEKILKKNVTKNKYQKKLNNVKNEKIKESLRELTKVFKEK